MKKRYACVLVLILLFLMIFAGYYFYLEKNVYEYQFGTFVELPEKDLYEQELDA